MKESERKKRREDAKIRELSRKPYEAAIGDNVNEINQATFKLKEQLWFSNLGENMAVIRHGLDVSQLPRHDGETALVIAAGPSVLRHNQLNTLCKYGFNGPIIVVDKILSDFLSIGFTPSAVISCDGDPQIAQFFNCLPSKAQPWTTSPENALPVVLNALTISPMVVKALSFSQNNIYWYISFVDDPQEPKSLTRVVRYMTDKTMLQSLGNVGGTAWNLALYLGCTRIGLMGLDYGYPADTKLEDTIYYKAYTQLVKEKDIENCFRIVKNPLGNDVLTDLNWDVYKKVFLAYSKVAKADTVNLSPDSSLFGPRIRFQSLEDFLSDK